MKTFNLVVELEIEASGFIEAKGIIERSLKSNVIGLKSVKVKDLYSYKCNRCNNEEQLLPYETDNY